MMQFLKGIGQGFESKHAPLLHQTTLVSLDEAIAAMSQEVGYIYNPNGNQAFRGSKTWNLVLIIRLQSRGGDENESAYGVAG